jgi:hypothetical protein
MNTWLLLALGPVVVGLVMTLATVRNARGVPVPLLGYGNAHVNSGDEQWRSGHRAALPAIVIGTVIAAVLVTTGAVIEGIAPAIGPWALAAFVVVGASIFIGGLRSRAPQS